MSRQYVEPPSAARSPAPAVAPAGVSGPAAAAPSNADRLEELGLLDQADAVLDPSARREQIDTDTRQLQSLQRALRDVVTELAVVGRVRSGLVDLSAGLRQRTSAGATSLDHAQSAARAPGSPGSVFRSDAEDAEIAHLEASQAQQRAALDEIAVKLPLLDAHLAGLNQRLAQLTTEVARLQDTDRATRDQYRDVIDTGEGLDAGRTISYETRFQAVDDPATAQGNPAEDPDQNLKLQLEAGWRRQQENCCIYIVHTLTEAGYDLDEQVVVNGQQVTVRRLVMIHAETLLQGAQGSLSAIATDPTSAYHDVLKGVVTALTRSGQGAEVDAVDDVRPGDLLQWWTASNHGHTTIIHEVKTDQGVLDKTTNPEDPRYSHVTVSGVAVLGAQREIAPHGLDDGPSATTTDLDTKQDQVYVTDFIALFAGGRGQIPGFEGRSGEIVAWWAVRPSGSRWVHGAAVAAARVG